MPYQTVTLSSADVPGQSAPIVMAWRNGAPASAAIYPSTTGTSSATFSLQYTMDDVQLVGGTSLARWANVSSAYGSSGTVYSASAISVDGVFYSFLSPVAALRINATALSSGPLTMKVIQGESW